MASKNAGNQQDGHAPDLEIFKDQITLHRQGFVAPPEKAAEGGERALMSHTGRFREAPLEWVPLQATCSVIV